MIPIWHATTDYSIDQRIAKFLAPVGEVPDGRPRWLMERVRQPGGAGITADPPRVGAASSNLTNGSLDPPLQVFVDQAVGLALIKPLHLDDGHRRGDVTVGQAARRDDADDLLP
jgi:hypothetical protein